MSEPRPPQDKAMEIEPTQDVAGARLRYAWAAALIPVLAFAFSQEYGGYNLLGRLLLAVALGFWTDLIVRILQSRREQFIMLLFALFNVLGFILPRSEEHTSE